MNTLNKILASSILMFVLVCSSCIEDNIIPPLTGDLEPAAEVLYYLESKGNYANSDFAPSLVNADEVFSNLTNYLVLDIREETDYTDGHIEGAINVSSDSLYFYLNRVDAGSYPKIILVSKNGQSSAYFTCLLHLAGYNNIYSMNYGMASWNAYFADEWLNATGDDPNILDYTNDDFPKNELTDLPEISFENPEASLEQRAVERVNEIISRGFVFTPKLPLIQNYYLGCYGTGRLYYAKKGIVYEELGHPIGTVYYQTSPLFDLNSSRYLQSLPTNQQIIIYDADGQLSACMSAYLRVLGYDAKPLLFGANQLFYSRIIIDPDLKEYAFGPDDIQNFPYVTGN